MRALALVALALLVAAGAASEGAPYRDRGKLPVGTWVAGTAHVYHVTLAEGDTLDVELAWDESQGVMQAYVVGDARACAPDDAACLADLAAEAALLCGAASTPFSTESPARLRFVAPRSGEFTVWVAPVLLTGLTWYEVTMSLQDASAPLVGRHSQGFTGGHASPACGLA